MAGAESLGVVKSESVLAQELLVRCHRDGTDGVISFPQLGIDFVHGKLEHALGAL